MPRSHPHQIFLLFATSLYLIATTCGCAEWKRKKTSEFKLPRATVATNAIGLDILVAQISQDKNEVLEETWSSVDFLNVDLETRKLFDKNGLRVGILPSSHSSTISQLFGAAEIDQSTLDEWQQQVHKKGLLSRESSVRSFNRIQHQAGTEHVISVSDVWDQQSWIIRSDKGQSVGVGEQVEAEFELKTFNTGDGSVRLRLLPRICHGFPRPQFDVDQNQFLVRAKKTELDLRELLLDIELQPGEILMIGATPDLKDLGRLFFRPGKPLLLNDFRVRDPNNLPPVPPLEQKLLLIRLLPPKSDALFND